MKIIDVIFLDEAYNDIENIASYIAKDSKASALNIVDKIVDRCYDLLVFPKRGPLVPDKKMREAGYRMLGIKPYIAFYRIVDYYVIIYRVLHGASDYPLLYEEMIEFIND